jgi:hypothetical protein
MPFDHCCRFDEYQGVQDPRPHSVKAHPQEPVGGMKTEAARGVAAARRSADVAGRQARVPATLGCETGTRPRKREQTEW